MDVVMGMATDNGRPPPFLPAAEADFRHRVALDRKGTPVVTLPVICRPDVPVSVLEFGIAGFEVVQTPKRVLFLFELDNTAWVVHLDRDHPSKLAPSYLGDSVGHWEGNTLVIDSVGFNGLGTLASYIRVSPALHLTTRVSKVGDRLNFNVRVEDPQKFSAPWNMSTKSAAWSPTIKLFENHCPEDMRPEAHAGMVFEDLPSE